MAKNLKVRSLHILPFHEQYLKHGLGQTFDLPAVGVIGLPVEGLHHVIIAVCSHLLALFVALLTLPCQAADRLEDDPVCHLRGDGARPIVWR